MVPGERIENFKEGWAVGPNGFKAHYFRLDDPGIVRRLCARRRFRAEDMRDIGTFEKCRICLNIQGKIVTRRHTKRLRTGMKLGDEI
jgi:hypothetical protein